ncbi:colicin E3/pyocin S6 family cytotoxin [Pseudomonas sp. DSP3-2-2]|uniref:colicin E3/pyocin S6 family cytotoxin n=1 Tax=unclassified Pseudomonas TaxID=196821 RepID=UPI003CF82D0B
MHTTPSGDDSVRTVQATWNSDRTAMEAKLNGITIIWTPRDGRLGPMPPLIYPDNSGAHLNNILVHPIPENTDSQIEGFPGEDITVEDCIVVFPAGLGWKSMYVVFARPFNGDIEYHKPPLELPAFPDTIPVKSKSSVQGGGGKRSRWKDRKGRLYEWDSKTGAIELYDKQGRHLSEFNHETGEQIDPPKPGRTTPK